MLYEVITFGGPGGRRLGEQPLGQGVVGGGEAGGQVELALQVPHPLAQLQQAVDAPVAFAGGIHLRGDVAQGPGEGGESYNFV